MDLPALIKQSKGTKLPQELFVAAKSYVDKMKLYNQYTMLLVYSCWYKPFCPKFSTEDVVIAATAVVQAAPCIKDRQQACAELSQAQPSWS